MHYYNISTWFAVLSTVNVSHIHMSLYPCHSLSKILIGLTRQWNREDSWFCWLEINWFMWPGGGFNILSKDSELNLILFQTNISEKDHIEPRPDTHNNSTSKKYLTPKICVDSRFKRWNVRSPLEIEGVLSRCWSGPHSGLPLWRWDSGRVM